MHKSRDLALHLFDYQMLQLFPPININKQSNSQKHTKWPHFLIMQNVQIEGVHDLRIFGCWIFVQF